MPEPIRLGLIGCGFFAHNHLSAWKALAHEGVELVAVCDTDRAKAEGAAREFAVPGVYTDAAEMFSEARLGLVDIVTQVRSHRPLVEMSIAARVPTIVQKPFGLTLDDCVAMTELSRSTGIPLAVHENFRFQPAMQTAKAALDAGEIGEPNWARISFRTGYDIYAGQPYLLTEQRFVINDLGAHVLDLARFFLGEVEHLNAETQRRRPDLAGEDTATMMLRHKSGAVSTVECTYESRRLPDLFPETLIEIEGTKGAIAVKSGSRVEITSAAVLRTVDADPELDAWMERPWHVVQTSVLETCRHILQSLRQGRAADVSASDNLNTMALCDAAYVSASSRQPAVPRSTDPVG